MTPDSPHNDEPLLEDGAPLPEHAFRLTAPPAALRERIYAQTAREVRGRRRGKRLRVLGGLAAAYAAGLATVFLLPQASAPQAPPGEPVHVVAEAEPAPAETPATEPETAAEVAETPPAPTPLELLRKAAFAPFEERPALLRQAGDLYFEEYGDIESALHCYREYLDSVATGTLELDPFEDNWLLVSLKQARLEEYHHAS